MSERKGEWRKGRNCAECYFYSPEFRACVIGELHEWKGKECDEHFVDWDLLLKVDPWDSRLPKHFPEERIRERIRKLEGRCK